MIDEVHERKVDTDTILYLVRELIHSGKRPDLKLILMTATGKMDEFINYFRKLYMKVDIVQIPGKTFPVEYRFIDSTVNKKYREESVKIVKKIINDPESEKGDILIFYPGIAHINKSYKDIMQMIKNREFKEVVLPFIGHANISVDESNRIQNMLPNELGIDRKIILSTNYAENSLTIKNLKYVIETGTEQRSGFDMKLGIKTLDNTLIAQANAKQRWGRVGRKSPGIVYMTYTENEFKKMDEFPVPAILREDLTSTFLLFLYLFKGDERINLEVLFKEFFSEFITPPTNDMFDFAEERLRHLGAINEKGYLTKLGERMATFQMIEPEMAKSILYGDAFRCTNDIIALASILAVDAKVLSSLFLFDPNLDRRKYNYNDHIYFKKRGISFRSLMDQEPWLLVIVFRDYIDEYEKENDKLYFKLDNTVILGDRTENEIYNTYIKPLLESHMKVWCQNNMLDYKTLDKAHTNYTEYKNTHLKNRLVIIMLN